jgi:hypothetical protein
MRLVCGGIEVAQAEGEVDRVYVFKGWGQEWQVGEKVGTRDHSGLPTSKSQPIERWELGVGR